MSSAQTQNIQKRWINWRCGDGVHHTSSHLQAGDTPEKFTFSFGLERKGDLIPCEDGRSMMLPHPPTWELFFTIRSFSGAEVATILQESKVKDGAVLICPGSELWIYSPGLADPGVEIVSKSLCAWRPSRLSSWLKNDPQVVVWTCTVHKLYNFN